MLFPIWGVGVLQRAGQGRGAGDQAGSFRGCLHVLQERGEGMGQHLVRTVAEDQALGLQPMVIGDGVALMGAAKFPARVKCVLMPWKAYQAALLETRALRG